MVHIFFGADSGVRRGVCIPSTDTSKSVCEFRLAIVAATRGLRARAAAGMLEGRELGMNQQVMREVDDGGRVDR